MEKQRREIKYLGYYQYIGGIVGVLIVLWESNFIFFSAFNNYTKVLYLVLLLFPLFSIYTGHTCLKQKKNCLSLSKVNQLMQIISVSLFGLTLKYHSGLYFGIGIETTDGFLIKFDFGISSIWFAFSSANENSIVMINLIALYLLSRIIKIDNKIEDLGMEIENISSNDDILDDGI